MHTGNEILRGLRVLDLSRVLAGPLCCQMLGDHGATVIKVEPPSGDDTRAWGPPFVKDDASAYFNALNRNKRNICIDLKTESGRGILASLLAESDVVVENFKAGTLDRWGFSDDAIREKFPSLILCRITGFGSDGPMGGLPGYDAVAQAYGGLMSVNGEADRPGLRVGVPIVDMVTGIYAFSGILLALKARAHTNRGQIIECTLADTAVSLLHPHSSSYLVDGVVPVRTGSAHPTTAPYDTFCAADGEMFIGVGNDRQFQILVDVLGIPELGRDPAFKTNADRKRNLDRLTPVLTAEISKSSKAELAERLITRGVPASPVRTIEDVLTDSHTKHRDMILEDGDYVGIGSPIKLSENHISLRQTPRCKGADTVGVLRAAGYSEERIERLIDDGVVYSKKVETLPPQ